MNLHEYQAKELLQQFGVAVPRGTKVTSQQEAVEAAKALGGPLWVVKAQVHAGGRGKAGGVKLARSLQDVEEISGRLLGSTLVTKQTGAEGVPVHALLIQDGVDITNELYLSCLVDRSKKRIVFIGSSEGGMDIEEVAAKSPEKILTVAIEPELGRDRLTLLTEYPAREAALARLKPGDPRVSERFEMYACGVELANGFGELVDPQEQRARFTAAMAEKQKRYGEAYPIDEDFLRALEIMPEASGVALGFDRLVMLAAGAERIEQVLWTPVASKGPPSLPARGEV